MVEITHWVWVWAPTAEEAERLVAREGDLGTYDADPEIIVHVADFDPDADADTVPIGGRGVSIRNLLAEQRRAAADAVHGGPRSSGHAPASAPASEGEEGAP